MDLATRHGVLSVN